MLANETLIDLDKVEFKVTADLSEIED